MVTAMVSQMCVMCLSSLAFGHDTLQIGRPYMGQSRKLRIRLFEGTITAKLGAQHDAPGGGIERITAVDHAPVVPHDKVATPPDVAVLVPVLDGVRQQFFEQSNNG